MLLLATTARPSLKESSERSSQDASSVEAVFGSVRVEFGAGSPLNLGRISDFHELEVFTNVLVRHNHKEAFCGIFVGLQLIVYGFQACAASEEKEKFGRGVGIIGRFGDVHLE
jgi:hypothetical protein